MSNPLVSIVITTRNRWKNLEDALTSCLDQDYSPIEIIVYNDASDEDNSELILNKFPQVKITTSDTNIGYIVLRNKGFKEAKGKYVFSIDDDAYYTDKLTISSIVRFLESSDKIAVVSMPFYEPNNNTFHWNGLQTPNTPVSDKDINYSDDISQSRLVASFIGTAHAIRRAAALEVGGYREFFFHQGEEQDLSLRLLERGWNVAAAYTQPIIHLASPVRDWTRLHLYGPRNSILFIFLNVPSLYLIPRIIVNTLGILMHGVKIGQPVLKIKGVMLGYLNCIKYYKERKPVSIRSWRRFRRLLKNPEPLSNC